jgi:DNA repair protein RecO (recombination protein O)
MSTIQDHVLVLKSRPYRDHDALVTGFGRHHGKMAAVARGARTAKSRLAAGVQALTLAHWTLYQGRSALLTVTQADAERHYPRLRQDLDRMGRAAMLADLVDELWSDGDAAPDTFAWLAQGWAALDEGRAPTAVFLADLWHLLREAGLKPDFSICAVCGLPLGDAAGWRDGAGPVCRECRREEDAPLSVAGLAWLRRAEAAPPDRLGLVVADAGVLARLERQARAYVAYHLGRLPRAFRVWDEMQEDGPQAIRVDAVVGRPRAPTGTRGTAGAVDESGDGTEKDGGMR